MPLDDDEFRQLFLADMPMVVTPDQLREAAMKRISVSMDLPEETLFGPVDRSVQINFCPNTDGLHAAVVRMGEAMGQMSAAAYRAALGFSEFSEALERPCPPEREPDPETLMERIHRQLEEVDQEPAPLDNPNWDLHDGAAHWAPGEGIIL